MKILLVGEYSNVHATLAEGFRALGHEATVLSNGDFWKNYPRDINLERTNTKLGGILYILRLISLLPKLRGYDVVQLISPMFLELKAERIMPVFRYLKRHNKKVFLGATGIDWYWVNTCLNEMPLRYSDYNIGHEIRQTRDAVKDRETWIGTYRARMNQQMAADCDGITAVLYEYWVCYHRALPEKTRYIPLPIKMPEETDDAATAAPQQGKVKLFIGINKTRSEYKGTDIMLKAAEDILKKYPERVELKKAISVPFHEYQKMMNGCDAILDQLYSYTPSMNSLLAMSKGIVVIGGGEEEHYELLGEKELRPIINVQPNYDSVYRELEQLVLHPEQLPELKRQSIEYVRRYYDYLKVAQQYLDFYLSAPTTEKAGTR